MRTDRTKLRDRFLVPAAFAVMWAVKVFWAPEGILRWWAAGAAGVFFWWAGMKYLEYREKYPRKRNVR